jgi:PAS domain S-box-containing protein
MRGDIGGLEGADSFGAGRQLRQASKPDRIDDPTLQVDEIAGRLAALVDSSDDAIVSKTLDGVITSWNAGAERMFGYSAREAVGQHITLIIPEERWSEEGDVLAHIRRGERVDHFETVRRAKDGHLVDISLTVSPVRNAAGQVIGVSKIARDITERRRIERERAIFLQREQEARAEAEALNRSKDQFLATLSHELRTPLNAIFGWARMLQTGQLDPAMRSRATEAIVRNARAQVQLLEDLLDVSRIITGNMRLEVRPVNLKTVVEAALEAVEPAANAKGIRLQTMLDPQAGPIMGAPDRLQQVVWNLLMNAVKFTPRNGRVQVYLHKANSHIEIIVSDTGEGIAPEILPHLFERFRQGDGGSSRRHAGLGIGLALVRHLIELHGGTVTAESPGLGMGASVTVKLPIPLMQPPVRPIEPQESSVGRPTDDMTPVSLRGLRILVVDDDPDGLEMARLIFVNAGAEVRTSTSVPEGLAILEAWWPDFLVADIEMPGEDGFRLLRRARTLEARRGRRLPAVALTGYGRAEDRMRVLAAGFNLHLTKPVDPAELALAAANVAGRTG